MTTATIQTAHNYPVQLTTFDPGSTPKGIVIIAPATGVKQTLYFKFSDYLKDHGYAVFTFDYGGIGASRKGPLSKFNTSASAWGKNDLDGVIAYARKQYPETKMFVVGHSIGGQLIGISPAGTKADSIVLVAAQTGYWKLWNGLQKYKMFMVWYFLIPVFTRMFGYFPGKKLGSSEDLPKDMALEWRKWCVSPNYLFDHLADAADAYKTIHCPIYSYSVEDDSYAPKITVDWLTNKYENAEITRRHLTLQELGVKKVGHFGFFRSKNKETIWKLFLNHFENQL